ncbi:unnamed protein product [Staurois parvus]|uniref:Secreted protein n=1 Tax=Staurois parvus TaxID=386267 RepID=A0ABN9DUV7_9NEOB|nr:unnamed protein product [Staurois parvus]
MPHISAHLSCLSVPVSAAYQCHQCSLSVPITAASLAHISEGEKSLIYKILKQKLRKNFFFFSKFSVVFGLRKNKKTQR